MSMDYLSVVFVILLCHSSTAEVESAISKFHYDKQMLETMVKLEAKMNQWDRERKLFEETVLAVLEHRRDEMDGKFEKEKERLDNILEDYKHVRDDVTNKMSQLEAISGPLEKTPKIAFNAYRITGGSYGVNKTLTFPNVLLNEGDGYDKTTGVFTAPVAGLYQFGVHTCHVQAKYMVVAIVHGHTEVAVTTGFENGGSSCNSITAPVTVEKGGRVYVKSTYTSELFGDNLYRWPSFTGVLINI